VGQSKVLLSCEATSACWWITKPPSQERRPAKRNEMTETCLGGWIWRWRRVGVVSIPLPSKRPRWGVRSIMLDVSVEIFEEKWIKNGHKMGPGDYCGNIAARYFCASSKQPS